MLETATGASAFFMGERFVALYPDAEVDLGPTLFRDWLHRKCRDLVKPPKTEQTQLPGFGDVPNVVTTYDGEGQFVYKRLRFASRVDLVNDEDILVANAVAADQAAKVAQDRNQVLIPIMDQHGFITAEQAIEFLGAAS
jgi:hypothetical protein